MKECNNCVYFREFEEFVEYFGTPKYADDWIKAAFAGSKVSFGNGNANVVGDFTTLDFKARAGKTACDSFICCVLSSI